MVTADNDRDRIHAADGTKVDVFDLEWHADGSAGLVRVEFDLVDGVTRIGIVLDGAGVTAAMVADELPLPVRARPEKSDPRTR